MSESKDLDKRITTRGGATIRIETWVDTQTDEVVRYNLAYVHRGIYGGDNGRVIGFDNSHRYRGFTSDHHYHRFGQVLESPRIQSFDAAMGQFDVYLKRLKRCYAKEY